MNHPTPPTQARMWPHGRVRCADAVHARLFDEELVILDLAKGEYFALDKVGARLWAGLDAGRSIEEIAEEVVAEYDVTFDRALADLVALGEELVARRLLVQSAGGAGSGGEDVAKPMRSGAGGGGNDR